MFLTNLHCRVLIAVMILTFAVVGTSGQEVVDKTVAVVSDRVRAELITYSDLMWQLALQPGTPLDPPRSEDLNRALQSLIDQRIFALEAQRIPRSALTDKEIADEIAGTLAYFPSPAIFEGRLKQTGFSSVKDPAFERLISERLAIQKYVDFRFGSFVVVTADEEATYFRDIFLPDFRRRFPGRVIPTLNDSRLAVHEALSTQKKAAAVERFLDDAKRRVQVEILIEV